MGLVAVLAAGCAAVPDHPGGNSAAPVAYTVDPAAAQAVRVRIAEEYDRQAAAGRAATEAESRRQEAARVAAEQAAAEQAAAEMAAAEQAAAEQAAAATQRQTQTAQAAPDLYETGWYDERGWVSPESARRAKDAGIPAGGTVPNYLRCGTICGESPTSGDMQSCTGGYLIRGTCYPSAEAARAAGEGE
jgi:hypothetical protein